MPISNYQTPGIYMEEISSGAHSIHVQSTSTAGFLGQAPKIDAYPNQAIPIDSYAKFCKMFVPDVPEKAAKSTWLSLAVKGFFDNGGPDWLELKHCAHRAQAGAQKAPAR